MGDEAERFGRGMSGLGARCATDRAPTNSTITSRCRNFGSFVALSSLVAPRLDVSQAGTAIAKSPATHHATTDWVGRGTAVNTRSRQMISGLVLSALGCALFIAGCSDDSTSSNGPAQSGNGGNANPQSGAGGAHAGAGGATAGTGGAHAGAGGAHAGTAGTASGGKDQAGAEAGAGAGAVNAGAGGEGAGCTGSAPECRGLDLHGCCGIDPYGPATCENGEWVCSLFGSTAIAAPGCNGSYCQYSAGSAGAAGAGG